MSVSKVHATKEFEMWVFRQVVASFLNSMSKAPRFYIMSYNTTFLVLTQERELQDNLQQ